MTASGLLFGNLTAEHYEDTTAADPCIDALRAKMVVTEDRTYTRDYLDPENAPSPTPSKCSSPKAPRRTASKSTTPSATAAAPRALLSFRKTPKWLCPFTSLSDEEDNRPISSKTSGSSKTCSCLISQRSSSSSPNQIPRKRRVSLLRNPRSAVTRTFRHEFYWGFPSSTLLMCFFSSDALACAAITAACPSI